MDKRLLVLAALVAAIWAGIHFWPEEKKVEKTDPVWLKLQPAKVKKIEQKAAESFSLDLDNGEWRITLSGDKKTPEPLRASLLSVEALVNFVSGNAPMRRLGPIPADKAKDFGLDKPKSSVTITAENSWTIELGDKNPTNDGIYAQSSLEPGECLLLDPKYAEQLNRKAENYYDLRLADYPAETVSKIRVVSRASGKSEEWEIEREDKGFAFTAPAEYASKPLVAQDAESYARALSSAKGKQLLLPAPPIPAEPYATITIWRKGVEAPVTYEIFQFPADFSVPGLAGQFFCRSSWQKGLLSLEKGEERRLARDAFSLRDRSAFKADVDALRSMKIVRHERQGQPTAEFLARKADKGGWTDKDGKALTGMDLLVWRLAQINYEAEPVKALPETAKPTVDWVLYKDKEQVEATLKFHRDPALPKGRCWLVVNDGELKFPVEDKLLTELTRDVPGDTINPDDMIMPPGMNIQGLPPGMESSLPPGVGKP
jgi:hypothetical protein